jgi:hypothetical protein
MNFDSIYSINSLNTAKNEESKKKYSSHIHSTFIVRSYNYNIYIEYSEYSSRLNI